MEHAISRVAEREIEFSVSLLRILTPDHRESAQAAEIEQLLGATQILSR